MSRHLLAAGLPDHRPGVAHVAHALYSGAHREAITGGTGRFANARGETKLSFLNPADTAAKVTFSITR